MAMWTRLLAMGVVMAVSFQAQAVPLADLFNTGVDSGGLVLAPGLADPHYSIAASPATVISNHPAWLANDAVGTPGGSSWIGTVNPGATSVAPGLYSYTTTFDLTGLDPNTASITMLLAVDNSVNVLLNGNPTGISHAGFASFSGPMVLNSGFQAGVNTLQFDVTNAGTGPNPAGLRVEFTSATAALPVPEPVTASLVLFGAVILLGRRRRSAV